MPKYMEKGAERNKTISSELLAAYLDGNANYAGLSAQGGSILAFGDINMEIESTIYFTALGGRILSGSGPNV